MSARWIDQTRTRDTHPDVRGDCTRAAIASLFALPLDTVPDFDADDPVAFYESVEAFFLSLGYEVMRLDGDVALDSLHLASGPAARGVSHSVVRRGTEIVHDPHPSRAGLLSVEFVVVPVPLDPSRLLPAQMSTRPAAAGGYPAPAVGGVALPGDLWAKYLDLRAAYGSAEDYLGREVQRCRSLPDIEAIDTFSLTKAREALDAFVRARLTDHQARPAAPEGVDGAGIGAAWRVGQHYGLHVYAGDRPVATFHDEQDALAAVQSYNAALNAGDGGAAAGDGWRDIATAPKDGTAVDLWTVAQKRGMPGVSRLRFTDCVWRDDALHRAGWWLPAGWSVSAEHATHWRPLPTPPTTSTTTGTEGRDHG